MIGCHAAAGHAVSALVPDPEKLARVMTPFPAGSAVEARIGDITDPESVQRTLEARLQRILFVSSAMAFFSSGLSQQWDCQRGRRQETTRGRSDEASHVSCKALLGGRWLVAEVRCASKLMLSGAPLSPLAQHAPSLTATGGDSSPVGSRRRLRRPVARMTDEYFSRKASSTGMEAGLSTTVATRHDRTPERTTSTRGSAMSR